MILKGTILIPNMIEGNKEYLALDNLLPRILHEIHIISFLL